jgi:hypothetical protein
MTRRHASLATVVVLLAGAIWAYRWWVSPERQILAMLREMAAAVSHDGPDTGLEALAAVAAIQQHLAIEAVIETPRSRIAGRQEIVALAARLRATTPMMRVRFFDPQLAVSGPQATLSATAEVTTLNGSGEEVVEVHDVDAVVAERDGKWLVTSARLVPAGEPDA